MKPVIYGLFDPTTHEIRYVGKTCNLAKRLHGHRSGDRRRAHRHLMRWLASCLERGGLDVEVLQECVSAAELNEAETFWIGYWRYVGANLLNRTNGGDGTPGLQVSEDTRRRMSDWQRGRSLSEEHRRNIALGQLGNKRGPETGEKIRAKRKGQPWPEEAKAKVRALHATPEYKAKARAAALARAPYDDAFREKCRQRMLGNTYRRGATLSPEVRGRLSEAQRRRWARVRENGAAR